MPGAHVQSMLRFKTEQNELGRLVLLRSMDMADAIECVQLCCTEVGRTYLEQRLAMYEKYIPIHGEVHEENEEPEELREHLWKDILFSSTLIEDETNSGSLGQDAIELEYRFNSDASPYRGIINWLTHVSATDIAEAKSAINEGVPDEEVLAGAVIKIIGARKIVQHQTLSCISFILQPVIHQ